MSKRSPRAFLTLAPREIFRALGDPNRLRLFANLACCGRPCNIGEASACCPTDPSVASRHVAVLRSAGLVTCAKRGKEVLVQANVGAIVSTLRALADALERCCAPLGKNQRSSGETKTSSRQKQRQKRRKK
ncbi:MAG: helix-turn-helix transcriptional regulator [Deltaproteobacteria bacterium]|nr:helix-turn-helix transcriptional regulator [Deltaproteobacteria bacterium]